MEFNFNVIKLEKNVTNKKKGEKLELTDDEINFIKYVYTTIINSEDYNSTTKYLAAVYGMSESDIKFIRNTYFLYFADNDEKRMYNTKLKQMKKEQNRRGFIDLSAIISFIIFLSVFGITLAFMIYNLL